jgi:chemotaxis signal transduction protein
MSGEPSGAAAIPSPAGPPVGSAVRFALLAVDAVEYAVESAWVRRSLPAPEPLPAAILHGGVPFPVIDLRGLFGLPARPAAGDGSGPPPAAERLILLLDRPPGEDAATDLPGVSRLPTTGAATAAAGRWALVVDGLLGLEPLAAEAVVALPVVYRGPERRWFRGVVPRADGRITVLLRLEGLGPDALQRGGGAGC